MCSLGLFCKKKQNYVKQATDLMFFCEFRIAYLIYIMYNILIVIYSCDG